MTSKLVAALLAAVMMAVPGVAEASVFSCVQTLESPSPTSIETITFTVRNATSEDKGLVWVTDEGGLQVYAAITPGQTITQQSFVGHRWAILDLKNQCSFAFELEAGETSFEITE